jgi:hypothetical protein
MKSMKTLGLAVVAAVALAVVAGAGSASATVFCEENVEPCPEAKRWSKGTAVDFTLRPGTSLNSLDTVGNVLTTCTASTIGWTIGGAGGATVTVVGTAEAKQISLSSCTFSSTTVEGGELEFHSISGTSNATVTAKRFRITVNTVFFGSCVWGVGTGTHLGTLTSSGTGASTLNVNAVLTKAEGSGFACPTEFRIAGEYLQTSPSGTPLFVKAS